MKLGISLSLVCATLLVTLVGFQLSSTYLQKVVPMPTFTLPELRSYAQDYFQSEAFTDTHDDTTFLISNDSSSYQFHSQSMIYNRSVLKHPVGQITYRTTIDLKEEKIRFTTDSVYFLEYTRNRYSRYVPVNTSPIPLSDWEESWSRNESQKFPVQLEAAINEHHQAFVHFLEKKKDIQQNTVKLENW